MFIIERVVKLFWKLHKLPESIIIDRGVQFAARMIELNQILGIDTKLSIAYYP